MSITLDLYCKATNEHVEAMRCGSSTAQSMNANVLACFLAYHASIGLRGSHAFTLRNIRDSSDENLDESLEWTEANFRKLLARAPIALLAQEQFEQAPSGGVWVRRTIDGRII
jgi:hypothetical protein